MTNSKESLTERLSLLKEFTGPHGIETPEQAIDRCIAIVHKYQFTEEVRSSQPSDVETPASSTNIALQQFMGAAPERAGLEVCKPAEADYSEAAPTKIR